MDKNIIVELYKMNQQMTIMYIKKLLIKKNIKFYTYKNNIISINHKGYPMFSAHMDTVDEEVLIKEKLFSYANYLFRDNGILGADDKAGVNLILNHCENINFVLTVNEERGALGAYDLTKYDNFKELIKKYEVNGCIVLDRKGNSDIIGTDNYYCNKDFDDKIQEILTPLKYKKVRGVFCDADEFNGILPCVNLSVGYYNHHTSNEYLNIEDFNRINGYIMKLHNELFGLTFTLPEKEEFDWKSFYNEYYEFNKKKGLTENKFTDPYYDSVKDESLNEKELQDYYNELFGKW